MLWTSALAIYVLFWFLALFVVLPFYGRRAEDAAAAETVRGADRGAPASVPVARIMLRVTLLSGVLFALYYWGYTSGYFTRDMLNFLPSPPPR